MSLLNSDRELTAAALAQPEPANMNDTLRVIALLIFGAIVMFGAYIHFNQKSNCESQILVVGGERVAKQDNL